jgi:hypothetical protein
MKEADKDLDGFISYHEFIETFKSDWIYITFILPNLSHLLFDFLY